MLFPILVETGSVIMKLDPVEISDDIDKTTKSFQNKAQDVISKSTKTIAEDVKKQLKDSIPNMEN